MPSIFPSGGAKAGLCWGTLSGFRSPIKDLLRLAVLGQAFQPQQVLPVSPRNGVARHQPIHRLPEHSGKLVLTEHPHDRLWRGRLVLALQLPAFPAFDAVAVLEPPFQHARVLQLRHHGRVADFAASQPAGDEHLLRDRELGRAARHLEARFHFRAVPVGHPLRHKKRKDEFRRRGDLDGRFDARHKAALLYHERGTELTGVPGTQQLRLEGNYVGNGIAAAARTRRLWRSCTNTMARKFARFHSRAARTDTVEENPVEPVPVLPTAMSWRTTPSCASARPEFSPRFTSECSIFSATARYTCGAPLRGALVSGST